MALHGTTEGAKLFPDDEYWAANATNSPTFQLYYRFDIFQIKGYFSRSKDDLLKVLSNAAVRSNNAANGNSNPTYIQELIGSNLIDSDADSIDKIYKLYKSQKLNGMKFNMDGLDIPYALNIKKAKLFPIWYERYYSLNNILNPNDMDIDNSSDSEDSIVVQHDNASIGDDEFDESTSNENYVEEDRINELIDQDEVENICNELVEEEVESSLLKIDDIPELLNHDE